MAHVSAQTRIERVTDGVLHRALGAETVLVALERRLSYALNPVGTAIWNLADGQRTVAGIASALGEIYDVAPEVALQDTLELVAGLIDRGLMAVVDEPALPGGVEGRAAGLPG